MRILHTKADPEWGLPEADRLSGGAGRPATTATSALLLEPSSTAYETQSKPYIEIGLILSDVVPPSNYISSP
jgi:hypothetical protein